MNSIVKFPSEYLVDAFMEITQDFAETEFIDQELHVSYPEGTGVIIELVYASLLAGYEAAYIEATESVMPLSVPSKQEIH